MAYGAWGLDLLQTLKTAAGTGVQRAKAAVLTKAGTVIAESPEGQAAIQRNLLERAKAGAVNFTQSPYFIPGLAIVGLVLLSRRGRR